MDETVKNLQQERAQNIKYVSEGKIPSRVPINVSLGLEIVAEYAHINVRDALWQENLLEKAADELCERIPSDVCVYAGKIQKPGHYQTLGSRNCVMSQDGFMQHPNTVGLLAEEYDDFIKNPFDCIVEKVLPRNYRELDFVNQPAKSMFSLVKTALADAYNFSTLGAMLGGLSAKYGYPMMRPGTFCGCYAPMDILTDNLRSFSGMVVDVRRYPKKVKAAVEAVYPLNYKAGKPAVLSADSGTFFPLHMATFLREKDFAELWWPQWFRQVNDYASLGLHSQAFCEHDWMRYLDYLQDLPTNTKLMFEYGDAKIIKEKLGKKHILTGLFPISILTTCTKQQCIDKTKEFIDIMAPGGRFYFSFDKSPLILADVNIENLAAICETVLNEGKYTNVGEPTGEVFDQNDYTHSEVPEFTSKYYTTWEQYKELNPMTPEIAKNVVMSFEDQMLSTVYGLCQ